MQVFPRRRPVEPPPLNVFTLVEWTTFLLGGRLERHPTEWHLSLHLGPLTIWIERVR